ncbi:MAG: ABC transporter, partial [Armatimonadota bacterium]
MLGAVIAFALFFSGARYLAGPALFGERLEALVVSLIAWSLAFSLLAHIASNLAEEALAGLLEQLALTRPGLLGVVLVRASLSLLQTGLLVVPVVLAILLTSGARLDFQPLALLPLGTLALGALGLGLVLGGLALIYKRVGQLLGLLQFLVLGLFLVRFEALAWPWNNLGYFLPLTPSVTALRLLL